MWNQSIMAVGFSQVEVSTGATIPKGFIEFLSLTLILMRSTSLPSTPTPVLAFLFHHLKKYLTPLSQAHHRPFPKTKEEPISYTMKTTTIKPILDM